MRDIILLIRFVLAIPNVGRCFILMKCTPNPGKKHIRILSLSLDLPRARLSLPAGLFSRLQRRQGAVVVENVGHREFSVAGAIAGVHFQPELGRVARRRSDVALDFAAQAE